MKKTILFIFLGTILLSLQSCTKTCTCVDANNKVEEIEIDPTESCSIYSGGTFGECS